MQLSTLLPILALLATPVLSVNPHRRHAAKGVDHARAVERLATVVERREVDKRAASIAAGHPRALETKPKRKVVRKRGATCRAKTSSTEAAAATPTEVAATKTSSSEAAPAATTSSSSLDAEENYTNPTQVSQTQTEDTNQNQNNNQNNYQTQTSEAAESQASATATSTSAAAAASSSAASSSGGSSNNGNYTPNGIKAGIAGGDAYDQCEAHIGWWYDWSANPSGHSGTPIAVPMLWGAGTVDSTDASRLDVFKAISSTPQYIMGFEEPDCSTWGSANIDVSTAAGLWNTLIGPWKAKGSTLISPSMCHQAAEQYIGWLGSFEKQISVPWDITNIHVNKNNMDGVKADIDYYWNTFGKPIWVTEFACVDDSSSFIPCTDQSEINTYINEIVDLFEGDSRVHAYAYSNGDGLGDVWPMYSNGALSQSGQTYINAISKYH
ncbi:uncharacterized protein I303_108707 [Kwoniella dejecticola CBS 10117]|uniref:Asl1-like glycosyl hydrolase catalytic domain-containing protein n=1 Tax=Kwoniella dejecticola CBS 10117 TaxID=1296121 RepID=A0A1A5ZWM4_9TREE|nr:uncharacterized protein I303_06968 [Kwoniella dejecticola CBS 10117]OBR82209.1 hypothetical protein I303_06968 [Kwoniella dejecticola CBS 10117]